MRKEFTEELSSLLEIRRPDLIEKDIILHELLISPIK